MVWNVTLSQLLKRAVRHSRTYHRVLCMFYSSAFSLSEKAVKRSGSTLVDLQLSEE